MAGVRATAALTAGPVSCPADDMTRTRPTSRRASVGVYAERTQSTLPGSGPATTNPATDEEQTREARSAGS